jgi:ketosteroid isomerase-like protein
MRMSFNVGSSKSRQAGGEAESLVNAYIAAYEAKDATTYLSLFSRDADYIDFAVQVHAKIRQLKDELISSFHREGFRFKIRSFFVSADGRFAALQGTYSDSGRRGQAVSVPIASFLEIRDAKITRETLYYDGSLFKRHLHSV